MRSRRPQASSTADARRQARCRQRASSTNSFRFCDQCAVLFQDDTGLVQVVRLLHWGPPSVTSATMYTISSPPPHSISKRAMWELTWRFYRESWHCWGRERQAPSGPTGVVTTARTQRESGQHGRPHRVVLSERPTGGL